MLRTFLFYLVLCLVAFIAIWYVVSFFELLNDMLTRDKIGRFVPYIYYLTPFLVYNTAPLAVMVATLVCFGILATHHELTAFRSCGVSLYRLALPILVVAAGLGGGLFALEESYLPESNRRQDALRDEIKGRPPRTYLRPDRQWTFGLRDRIFYHRAFDSRTKEFSGISVYDIRSVPFELRRHIHAERAQWDAAMGVWVFENGWVRELDGIGTEDFERFEELAFPSIVEPPDYFLKRDRHDQQMDLAQAACLHPRSHPERLRHDRTPSAHAQEASFPSLRVLDGIAGDSIRDADRWARQHLAVRTGTGLGGGVLCVQRLGGAIGTGRPTPASSGRLGPVSAVCDQRNLPHVPRAHLMRNGGLSTVQPVELQRCAQHAIRGDLLVEECLEPQGVER